ncbi:PQQ-dependent sugar dehydrogenase [Castellaniella sp.]|uniref:PQQ-dependent sugar dehydrogenase n=1 Tax=Castellaniella sp. TaxID=1955812 RepID=UPI002AFFEB0C|nr:PQQ-dependent sugar dehydrogenase [Castellaniella sp.]
MRPSLFFVVCTAIWTCLSIPAWAAAPHPINAGELQASASQPFTIQHMATLNSPWAMTFLPDGRLIITEKSGQMYLFEKPGVMHEITGVPKVRAKGQTGLHDVAASPTFAQDQLLYFTWVEPAPEGGVLVLARARLQESAGAAQLQDIQILWRQNAAAQGGHPGSKIAFSPDGQHLFLTVGERQDSDTAQDPDLARGKILRMNLDGSIPPDNPYAAQGGVRALTWSTGHRNPYGLTFDAAGTLWSHEMGPRGGDELNRIDPGKNYGWPQVSEGRHYSGWPIDAHATRPEFQAPVLYWTPVIAPSGMALYDGKMFPEWQGSLLISGLVANGLLRLSVDGPNHVEQIDRWSLGKRIRDVAVAPDGAIWLIEDGTSAALLRLIPLSPPVQQ